jgi:hypothetical protein
MSQKKKSKKKDTEEKNKKTDLFFSSKKCFFSYFGFPIHFRKFESVPTPMVVLSGGLYPQRSSGGCFFVSAIIRLSASTSSVVLNAEDVPFLVRRARRLPLTQLTQQVVAQVIPTSLGLYRRGE